MRVQLCRQIWKTDGEFLARCLLNRRARGAASPRRQRTPETVDNNVFESVLRENRLFPPPAKFAAKAWIGSEAEYERMYRESVEDPEGFWAEAAGELEWFRPWTKVIEGEGPETKWFVGGRLNLSHNCVDRHAKGSRRDKVALLWEGEPGEVRKLTYR